MVLPDFDAAWNFADPQASEATFRQILADHPGAPRNYRLELQTQIARALGLQRRFDEAHATLDGVRQALEGASATVGVRYLLERGRVLNSSGEREACRPLFLQAWDDAREAGLDGYAVDAAHMMGIVTEPAEQVRWSEEALSFAEASDAPEAHKWLGALYNNLGWSHHDLGDYSRALELFERGVHWREQQGKLAPIRIAKWSVGRTLRSLERFEDALAVQLDLLEDHERTGDADGFVFEELAELYAATGNDANAAVFARRAIPMLESIDWVERERIERLKQLARG